MIAFLETIVNFISTVFQWFVNTLESLFMMIKMLGSVVTFPVLINGLIPSVLGVCVTCVIAVAVIKLIVGWGNA